jgi:hypothetical protein
LLRFKWAIPNAIVPKGQQDAVLLAGIGSEEAYSGQNNPFYIVGIVHEMPDAVDHPIAARLLPRPHEMMLLDVPWFPKGLLPGVVGTGHAESLHVACGELRSQVPSHRPYRVEKFGLAEKIGRRILFRLINKNAWKRGVHHGGLPLDYRAADFLLHLKQEALLLIYLRNRQIRLRRHLGATYLTPNDLISSVYGPHRRFQAVADSLLVAEATKFVPPNGHILRGLDPKADLVAPDLHDGHFDATADHDGFIFMTAEYEHDCLPDKMGGRAVSTTTIWNSGNRA